MFGYFANPQYLIPGNPPKITRRYGVKSLACFSARVVLLLLSFAADHECNQLGRLVRPGTSLVMYLDISSRRVWTRPDIEYQSLLYAHPTPTLRPKRARLEPRAMPPCHGHKCTRRSTYKVYDLFLILCTRVCCHANLCPNFHMNTLRAAYLFDENLVFMSANISFT